MGELWYLDIYNYASNPAGRQCPVNSYYHESEDVVARFGASALGVGVADEIRISRQTQGQNPKRLLAVDNSIEVEDCA